MSHTWEPKEHLFSGSWEMKLPEEHSHTDVRGLNCSTIQCLCCVFNGFTFNIIIDAFVFRCGIQLISVPSTCLRIVLYVCVACMCNGYVMYVFMVHTYVSANAYACLCMCRNPRKIWTSLSTLFPGDRFSYCNWSLTSIPHVP